MQCPVSASARGGRPTLHSFSRGQRVAPLVRGAAKLAAAKYLLLPTGDCSTDHIADEVAAPGPIELEQGLYELGRAPPAGESDILVTDLGSTNGTYVDGEELTAMKGVAVLPGSTIVFGDAYLAQYKLEVLDDEE